jgi:hypothetical protein
MLGAMVTGEGRWRPHARDGYRAVAVDVTGFWIYTCFHFPTPRSLHISCVAS